MAHPEQYARMRRLRVSPSYLMGHLYYWGRAFHDTILGAERGDALDAARLATQEDENGPALPFSFHSDSPVTPPNPLLMVQAAVTRTNKDGDVLGGELRLTIDEALRAITIHPAWQIHREADLGSLEVGKLADFVILDQNPRAVAQGDPGRIGTIGVVETWVGGVRVYPR